MGIATWRAFGLLFTKNGKNHAFCEECNKAVPVSIKYCGDMGDEAICNVCGEEVLRD